MSTDPGMWIALSSVVPLAFVAWCVFKIQRKLDGDFDRAKRNAAYPMLHAKTPEPSSWTLGSDPSMWEVRAFGRPEEALVDRLSKRPDSGWERITYSLYDRQRVGTAGHAEFFTVPVGQGESVAGFGPKMLGDTNLNLAGSLPNLQAFIIHEIELEFWQDDENPADRRAFFFNCDALLFIGSKCYMQEAPAARFGGPENPRITVKFGVDEDGILFSRIEKRSDAPRFQVTPNDLLLIPFQAFKLDLAHIPPLSKPAIITARLHGSLYRSVQ